MTNPEIFYGILSFSRGRGDEEEGDKREMEMNRPQYLK